MSYVSCSSSSFFTSKNKHSALFQSLPPSLMFVCFLTKVKFRHSKEITNTSKYREVSDAARLSLCRHLKLFEKFFSSASKHAGCGCIMQIQQSPICGPHAKVETSSSLSILFCSVSFPFSQIQLLIWQQSKETNEVLQQNEGFTGRVIVDRRMETRS